MTKGYHDSKTPEQIRDMWQTPRFVFDYYDRRFNFWCDLAASEGNTFCDEYYSEHDHSAFNAKKTDFALGANVWCNPPYSNIGPWVELCARLSRETGKVFVMLLPADTSVKWFADAMIQCSECHLISGRLSYINAETGKPVSGNNKGSVVFIFDPLSPLRSQVVMIDRDDMK